MRKLALAALLATLPAFAMAQTTQPAPRSGAGTTTRTDAERGASPNAPGQQMQSKGSVSGEPGASGYAPGHKMQARGSMKDKPGASGYAPGHKMQARGSMKDKPGASGYAPGQKRTTQR